MEEIKTTGLDVDYKSLLSDILREGVKKETRNGKVISVFGRQIRHNMKEGFPLLTTKLMSFKPIIKELMWFLQGRTDLRYLLENNCHIWDGDAYKNYCTKYKDSYEFCEDEEIQRSYTQEEFVEKIKIDDEFAKKWGDLGPIYGKQWRTWSTFEYDDWSSWKAPWQPGKPIDQISNLINELKTNPDSRRMLVNAWNVSDLENMVLPPCHYAFQIYTRELGLEERDKIRDSRYFSNSLHRALTGQDDPTGWLNIPTRAISLMWSQRSVDVPLGLPFNIASYGLLLKIIAKEVNMMPDELIGNLGDCHIYENQVDGIREQITREPFKLPNLAIKDREKEGDCLPTYEVDDFILHGYRSHPKIIMPLSN